MPAGRGALERWRRLTDQTTPGSFAGGPAADTIPRMIVISVVAAGLAVAVGLLAWRLRAARAAAGAAGTRLAAVLESLSAGLAEWSPDGRLTACNGRFREFYPAVELKPGLEYEDLVRYAATRAVVLVPEAEIDAWVERRVGRFGEAQVETLRTPDGRSIEVRTVPAAGGAALLLHVDVTAARAEEAAAVDHAAAATTRSADLQLLLEATAVGRGGAAFHRAAREILRLVGEWGGWHAGTVYLATADGGGALVSTGVWYVSDETSMPPPARAAVDACCDEGGDDLLRSAVTAAAPRWIGSLAVEPRLSDARRAALEGVRSLCVAPVTSDGRVVAVAELFARSPLPADPSRERLVDAAVDQLARVFDRERARLAETSAGPTHGEATP